MMEVRVLGNPMIGCSMERCKSTCVGSLFKTIGIVTRPADHVQYVDCFVWLCDAYQGRSGCLLCDRGIAAQFGLHSLLVIMWLLRAAVVIWVSVLHAN